MQGLNCIIFFLPVFDFWKSRALWPHQHCTCWCVELRDRKCSLSGKNDHNALWYLRNRYNAKFRAVAAIEQPQRVVTCEDTPWCGSRVVAVKGNDHNDFGLHENATNCRGLYLLQPRRYVRQVSTCRTVS